VEEKHILVTGDFVLDHHIYEGRRHHYGDDASVGVRVVPQAGGAALVHELLKVLLQPEPLAAKATPPTPSQEWTSFLAVQDPAPIDPASGQRRTAFEVPASQHAYAFWRPHPGRGGRQQFWRVSEAMGFGQTSGTPACETWPRAAGGESARTPRILVFSDGGMGFRGDRNCWQEPTLAGARWIVLKTSAPLATGQLWEMLTAKHRDRLVVVVSASELRKSSARVPEGLSWEQTLERLLRELGHGGTLADLARCRHLVVSFGSEGGLWLDISGRKPDGSPAEDCPVRFVYESGSIEGEHAHGVEGSAFGFLSCLAATTAWELAQGLSRADGEPDLERAIECAMAAMHDLLEKGHGGLTDAIDGFPAARLAEVIRRASHRTARACLTFDAPLRSHGPWSLLRDSLGHKQPAHELAALVVRHGPIALANLPHVRIGKLLSADPREIESLRSLTQVIRRYRDDAGAKRPLSIGVFGPPGAGKSFAVRELAQELVGESSWVEFNLSQFDTPRDLIGAFHQIRDRVLQRQLPVAFFDEFDAQRYRWLQHLLAPMQDGRFQEGQLTHAIGKCIFVCAGGTSWTFETFGPPPGDGRPGKEGDDIREFRLAKGPDFRSRLDACLDVVGPCRRLVPQPAAERQAPDTGALAEPAGGSGAAPPANDERWDAGHRFVADPDDVFFPIRRALMIRSELGCAVDELLEIDDGLLAALLRVETLRHGSRSLAKLLQPFQAAGRTTGGGPGRGHARRGAPGASLPAPRAPLWRSALLPAGQLAMHTDVDEFLRLCGEERPATPRPPSLEPEEVEAIAPAIHDTWREQGRVEGWLAAADDKDFDASDDFGKRSNRAAARRMIETLQLVGLHLERGLATPGEEAGIRRVLEAHVELLSDAEHRGWMDWHLAQGWRYADLKRKDPVRKLHPCLLPFAQLGEADRDKDRNSIRHYPEFARRASRKIVRAPAPPVPKGP
jgi:hypothetical protein